MSRMVQQIDPWDHHGHHYRGIANGRVAFMNASSFHHKGNSDTSKRNESPIPPFSPAISFAASAKTGTVKDHGAGALEVSDDRNRTKSNAQMADEYGALDCSGDTFTVENFILECGDVLPVAQARFNTFGVLNGARDNVVVVCHALTGNSKVDQWWGAMLGPGKVFDTTKYLIVCANILGSCYGSTGPTSINPASGRPYLASFPKVTIRDTVRLHLQLVRESVRAQRVFAVVGGSMGGMQALEWALLGGDFVRAAVVIGCGAKHSAWQIGFSETQRQAIYADPKWKNGNIDLADPPTSGLSVARQIAMISYRTAQSFAQKFGREVDERSGDFQVKRYLEYQGNKMLSRFDALTYVKITEQMDTHDVGRGRGSWKGKCSSLLDLNTRLASASVFADRNYNNNNNNKTNSSSSFNNDSSSSSSAGRNRSATQGGDSSGNMRAGGGNTSGEHDNMEADEIKGSSCCSCEPGMNISVPSVQSTSGSADQPQLSPSISKPRIAPSPSLLLLLPSSPEEVAAALGSITAKVLVIGIDSDLLYPLSEQEELHRLIPGSELRVVRSINGHDGFLLEQDQVGDYITALFMQI